MHEKVIKAMDNIPNEVQKLTDIIWKIAFLLLLPWLVYLTNEQKETTLKIINDVASIQLEMERAHTSMRLQMAKDHLDTIILIKKKIVFVRSEAAIEIAKDLRGLWFLVGVFKIIPVSIRDYFYKIFANNRYKIFGKRETCMIPTDEQRNRFI